MEKNRRDLKSFSMLVLLLVALDAILKIVTVCLKGLPEVEQIPEGMSADTVKIASAILFVLGFVVFLPQIYVGLKGMKIADGAKCTKAFIVWTVILLVIAAIATFSALSEMFKTFNFDNVLNFVSPALDVIIFAYIFVFARKIAGAK